MLSYKTCSINPLPYLEDTPKNISISEDETNVSVSYSFFSFYHNPYNAREGITNNNDFNFSYNLEITHYTARTTKRIHTTIHTTQKSTEHSTKTYNQQHHRENIYNGEKKDKTTNNGNGRQKKHDTHPFPFHHTKNTYIFSPRSPKPYLYIFPDNQHKNTLSLFPLCESTGIRTQQKKTNKNFFQRKLWEGNS